MFSLGFFEILALAVIALVVVGPEKLPGMARNIGRFLNEIKRTTNTITSEINAQIDEENFLKQNGAKKNQKTELDATEEDDHHFEEEEEEEEDDDQSLIDDPAHIDEDHHHE